MYISVPPLKTPQPVLPYYLSSTKVVHKLLFMDVMNDCVFVVLGHRIYNYYILQIDFELEILRLKLTSRSTMYI